MGAGLSLGLQCCKFEGRDAEGFMASWEQAALNIQALLKPF